MAVSMGTVLVEQLSVLCGCSASLLLKPYSAPVRSWDC